ncbi:MAG: NAD-dependent epimerase/dehydratase family protein [Armatimonadetes bacterium]|nr:NAD-dependent epimerase/dehydratase family protein [Armatimonadota bacterium]
MNDGLTLVTGGNGFLGKNLRDTSPRGEVVFPRRVEMDLLDEHSVRDWFDVHRPARVIHAAGTVGGIGFHRANPARMISENLRMGLNVLESAAQFGSAVTLISTACAYPVDAPIPTPEGCMTEGDPGEDTRPYGIAKRTLHTLCEALHVEKGMDYTILVPTNMYGAHDHFGEDRSHVVPALIRRAHESKLRGDPELVVWGDGTATRDLLDVRDASEAIWRVGLDAPANDLFNLSSGRETSIRELAETICEVVGFAGSLVFDPSKPAGAPRRCLDGSRLRTRYQLPEARDLRLGLAAAYAWYLTQLG